MVNLWYLHCVPSCQSRRRRRHRSTSGPGSAHTRLPAAAVHCGPPLQSLAAHRTGSASETVCDRTPLGETEAEREEEVEGKCFRVPSLKLRHLPLTSPLASPLGHSALLCACVLCSVCLSVSLPVQAPFRVGVSFLGAGEVAAVEGEGRRRREASA